MSGAQNPYRVPPLPRRRASLVPLYQRALCLSRPSASSRHAGMRASLESRDERVRDTSHLMRHALRLRCPPDVIQTTLQDHSHLAPRGGRHSKGTGHPTPKDVQTAVQNCWGSVAPPQRMCTNSWGSEAPPQRMCVQTLRGLS